MKLNYFNFKKLDNKILITTDFGTHAFVTPNEFVQIINRKIDLESDLGKMLLKKQIIYNDTTFEYSSCMKHDIRRIKGHVSVATSLHIFVVTTACNVGCCYCQANNGNSCAGQFMSKEIAEKAVDIALQSPAKVLNFEFQGGEPILNFDVIRHIVQYTEANKGNHKIVYNVVTNLTLLTDEIIDFFAEHNFGISTSLDGHQQLHDWNRPYKNGDGTFIDVVSSIRKIQKRCIPLGAIQTTTKESLKYPREIVRTYKDLGFESIFVRPLTPLGKAKINWEEIGYSPEEYLEFYKTIIDELIKINKNGYYIKEAHTAILMGRIDGNFINYMELRSPCGASIGQLAYYANGDIFTCDEGRMMHEMGDDTFRLGNVYENTYNDLINNGVCKSVCASSILESIPSCCDCVYQPYCGTCPVVNYSNSYDIIEKEPRSYRCRIYSGMLDYLFKQFMNNQKDEIDILSSWSNTYE